jgi:hypothetical protein
MNYQPVFTDPRVLRRAQAVLDFLNTWMAATATRRISRSVLYQAFGNTARPQGRWFLDLCLENTDPHWNYLTGKCKEYRVREGARQRLCELLCQDARTVTVSTALQQQMASGEFEYQHKNNRDFTPAQFLPREVRESTLANHGYLYHYDIRCAAPSLLLQRAQQLEPGFTAPHIQAFLDQRHAFRTQLAARCGITHSESKRIITAVFLGARILPHWHQNAILTLLGHDYQRCVAVAQDPEFCALRTDIRRMWSVLAQEIPRHWITDRRGHQRRLPVSARAKAKRYFELEHQVAQVIRRHLRKAAVRCLWLHDGWSSDQVCDLRAITQRVSTRTGFDLVIEWNKYHTEEIS